MLRTLADEKLIADLRARLELFREHVCQGCGCAAVRFTSTCFDCDTSSDHDTPHRRPGESYAGESYAAACVSVGMRALAGRRVFP